MTTDSWPLYDQTWYSSRKPTTILQPDNIILQYRWFIVSILLLFHLLYNLVHQSTASIYHLIPSTAISMIFFSSPSYQCQYQHQLPTTATIYPLFVTPKYITAAESAACSSSFPSSLLLLEIYINIDIHLRSYFIHSSSVFVNTMYTSNCVYKLISQLLLLGWVDASST